MSLQSLDQPAAVPATAKPGKEPRIPARVRDACALLASGECKTVKAAAERVKLSRTHLSRMLGRTHVQVFIERESRRTIALGQLRASSRVIELLDAQSEHVSLDASKHVLAIGNIRPPESGSHVSVNVGVSVGYVIDLTSQQPGARTIEHEAQSDAQ